MASSGINSASKHYLLGREYRNYKSTSQSQPHETPIAPVLADKVEGRDMQAKQDDGLPKSTVLDVDNPLTDETELELHQHEFDDLEYSIGDCCGSTITARFNLIRSKFSSCLPALKYILAGLLLAGYFAYFGYAMHCSFGDEGSIRLLCLTCGVTFLVVAHHFHRLWGAKFYSAVLKGPVQSVSAYLERHRSVVSYVGTLAFFAYFFGFIVGFGSQNTGNLVSGVGVIVVVLVSVLLSVHPTRVNWRPVMGGLTIQVTLAALVLRTQPGLDAFRFLGNRVAEFKQHAEAGITFVFGANFRDHFFAFSVLPVLVFFSSFIALLFHLGVLQAIIEKLGWLMQKTMGTTSGESLVAAAEMFVGQGPLLIRPFLGRLTNSELYAVITSGYATIPVGTLAAYISLGVPASHLICASVLMSPGALALAKIMCPETKKSKTDTDAIRKVKIAKYHNVIDAIGTGAVNSIQLVAAIAVNLVAFISMLTFLNKTLTWLGHRACLRIELTFELICAYAFWPIAYVIGVSAVDCGRVAELIGVKFFINEFVAYQRFVVFMQNRQTFLSLNDTNYYWEGSNLVLPNSNTTLLGGLLFEERSETIAIYALCGFANIGTVGIVLGLFSALIPGRKNDFVPLVIRGVITGTLANLLAASIAGVFYQPN